MKTIINILFTTVLLVSVQLSYGEEANNKTEALASTSNDDPRILVSIPDPVRKFMRAEMRSHLATISQILGYLTTHDLEAAANLAETNLGRGSMGKNRNSAIRPGMYMTPDMRNIGWSMHAAATEFAITAKKGDIQEAYRALQNVTNACVSCHSTFRTQ